MSWITILCFVICCAIIISILRREADPLSPGRVFGFIWSLAIGLADLKFSSLQHEWSPQGWILLLIGVGAFLVGTFISYVLNHDKPLVPLRLMRQMLRRETIREGKLFWIICASVLIYCGSYLANFLIRGWLPLDAVGTSVSRVEFNVSGLTLFIYTAVVIIVLIVLYFILVPGKKGRKAILIVMTFVVVGSFVLLLQRYPIIMASVICLTLLYYGTQVIRLRTALPMLAVVTAFFYWISSLRFSNVISGYLYYVSKMKFPKTYAMFTEPYMYLVTNLENFARSVTVSDYHTYGYFTLDFVTAIAGLKYWVLDYFNFSRTPYLTSNYNTYTAFWWFYSDFGVIGLAFIPWVLGLAAGSLYYRMRTVPTIKNVTAYGVMVFVMLISYFNFPFAFLWFEYIMLALYLILHWTLTPNNSGRLNMAI